MKGCIIGRKGASRCLSWHYLQSDRFLFQYTTEIVALVAQTQQQGFSNPSMGGVQAAELFASSPSELGIAGLA